MPGTVGKMKEVLKKVGRDGKTKMAEMAKCQPNANVANFHNYLIYIYIIDLCATCAGVCAWRLVRGKGQGGEGCILLIVPQ